MIRDGFYNENHLLAEPVTVCANHCVITIGVELKATHSAKSWARYSRSAPKRRGLPRRTHDSTAAIRLLPSFAQSRCCQNGVIEAEQAGIPLTKLPLC